MRPDSDRWMEVSKSQYSWEQEALAYVREALPDVEPNRCWSNFEFVADDGSINEVDLLVLSAKGFFLVEVKSRPGVIDGDAMTWRWTDDGMGKERVIDNPRLLANRKAKKLASLLQRQKALSLHRLPFLEPLVFLSASQLRCKLSGPAATGVCLRDSQSQQSRSGLCGIVHALTYVSPEEYNDPRRRRLDRPMAQAIARALEEAGIRRSQRHRRVGEYLLEKLLDEGVGYQDWLARHASLPATTRRVRLYPLAPSGAKDKASRQLLLLAAKREFSLLEGIEHPGILRPQSFVEHELGPALVFDHDPGAVRLDHFLAQRGAGLGIDLRLHLVRQIAEVLRHAHRQRLYHRGLCPASVLVRRPDASSPVIQILNWQTGNRDAVGSQGHIPGKTKSAPASSTHFGDLLDTAASAYLAPESQSDVASDGESLDVFSLGAVAYHILCGQPPAAHFLELHERLQKDNALRLDAVLDGTVVSLAKLIESSTAADLGLRISSVDDFLVGLDKVEDELTTPEPRFSEDPTQAKPGETLAPGIIVERRLGQGSTAVVFSVRIGDRRQALKLALEPTQNDRLRSEFEVLKKLDSPRIVKVERLIDMGSRVAILMAWAGDQTLGHRLRDDGPLQIDLLQRFGGDLLDALVHLSERGINHRDIKPDNLGVSAVGRGDVVHLTLFDFSLSRTPTDNLGAGTRPYLEPFLRLRKPPRWDEYAERFAATMTLYEMATGTLPRWGDGKTDPALQKGEVLIDAELFDAALREPLGDFFRRALLRDAKARFGSAEEMRDAWRQIFARVDEPAVPGLSVSSSEGDGSAPFSLSAEDIKRAERDTPLVALGISTRATNALSRANVLTVEQLLALPVVQVSHMRGVGNKTRKEIMQVLTQLGERFAGSALSSSLTGTSEDGGGLSFAIAGDVPSIDLLADKLTSRRTAPSETKALRCLLGLPDPDAQAPLVPQPVASLHWPSQTDVAAKLSVTRARIGQIVGKARERFGKHPGLRALSDEIPDMLRARGGVMTGRELRDALLTARGSAQREPLRSQLATAVMRAVIESEMDAPDPRWIVRRSGQQVLFAVNDNDGDMLADMAEQLGKRADALVAEEPLPSPARATEVLLAIVDRMGLPPLPAPRLLSLAAALSSQAAVSPRLELYPRSLDPLRALKLSRGGLLGNAELQDSDIHKRVRARYPEMEKPLPSRPELDELLRQAGWDLTWSTTANGGKGAYLASTMGFTSLTSGTPGLARLTHSAQVGDAPSGPEEEEALALSAKLDRASREGGLLILSVLPQYADAAKQKLAQRFAASGLSVYSIEEAILRHLKAFAHSKQIQWPVILLADAADRKSADFRKLQTAMSAALAQMVDEIRHAPSPLLLIRPGLLARYDRLKDVIESIRVSVEGEPGSATPPPGAPPFVWLLLPSDELDLGPRLDGQTVPVLTPAYWRAISPHFLRAALPPRNDAEPVPASVASSASPNPTSPKPARAPRKRRSS